jgi:hypothetical protein
MTVHVTNATYAFLDKFHYVDHKGKRANTNFVQTLFHNKKLTAALVKDAVDLETNLHALLRANPTQDVMFTQFKDFINIAHAAAVRQRDEFAPTDHNTITQSIPAVSAYDISVYGPHEITYYDAHKPYAAGKFEKELIAGLTAAKKCFADNSEGRIFCENKIQEIENYKPQEIRSNERTITTGFHMTYQR